MNLEMIVFILFAALTLVAGLGVAISRNVVYSVFLLFVILFGMAALYVLAGAEFLAVSQILIYVGGILILLLFGVMLTHKVREMKPRSGIVNLLPGLGVAGGLMAVLFYVLGKANFPETPPAPTQLVDTKALGLETVTHFLLPFEVISILLLVALIGAAYISRKSESPENPTS
ncbi:MAG: NADH-quinone oxidoreductase subunit J [Bacteroidia bacterium]|nr:NADH-quinone oxidoreductase subunit J [Bacteroidia bacterium]